MIARATLFDIDRIKKVADRYKQELGFVMRPALVAAVERGELLIHRESGAFCHYRRRRDGVSVIYEICVPQEYRKEGIGRALVWRVPLPIQLKCPTDNASNTFYAHLGFALLGTEPGKKRPLNLWRLETYPTKAFPDAEGAIRLHRQLPWCSMWYVWHPERSACWHISPGNEPVVEAGWNVHLATSGKRWQFHEYRPDGWPICPNCEEDELWCPASVQFQVEQGRPPTVEECVEMGLACYLCQTHFVSGWEI